MGVLIVLKVRANLENVAKITFPDDLQWVFDVQQSDGTELRKNVIVDKTEENEVQGSRGVANFVMKWEGARGQSSMSFFTPSRTGPLKGCKLFEYTAEQSGTFSPIAAFGCRGVEPVVWTPSI